MLQHANRSKRSSINKNVMHRRGHSGRKKEKRKKKNAQTRLDETRLVGPQHKPPKRQRQRERERERDRDVTL